VVDGINTWLTTDANVVDDSELSAAQTAIIAQIDANEVKIDTVDTVVDGINTWLTTDANVVNDAELTATETAILTEIGDMSATTYVWADTATALEDIKDEIVVIDGVVDSILTDTSAIAWGDITTIDGVVDLIKTDTTNLLANVATVDTDITAIDAVVDLIKTDTTSLLTNVATVDTVVDSIQVDTTAILADTSTIAWADITAIDAVVDLIKTDTTSLLTNVATVDTVVDSIQVDTTAILADTSTIAWADVTAILADTATINWSDVTSRLSTTDFNTWKADWTTARAGNLDKVSQVTESDGSTATAVSTADQVLCSGGTDGKAVKVQVVVDVQPLTAAALTTDYVKVYVKLDNSFFREVKPLTKDINAQLALTFEFTAEIWEIRVDRGADGLGAQTLYWSYVTETSP
jgi:hypothetical protein